MPPKFNTDILILGAGPAALSLATGIVRQQYAAIMFDNCAYRNAKAAHMHNVIAHDHQSPSSFRSQARSSILARYTGIEFKDTKIVHAEKLESGFRVTDEKGEQYTGRKLVLAVGVTDEMPSLPGYGALWGTRIFHCLFCHGYEERHAPSAGILAIPDLANAGMVLHIARMALRLVPAVTVYTHSNAEFGDEVAKLTGTLKIGIENRRILNLELSPGESGVLVHLADGSQVSEGFLVRPFIHPIYF